MAMARQQPGPPDLGRNRADGLISRLSPADIRSLREEFPHADIEIAAAQTQALHHPAKVMHPLGALRKHLRQQAQTGTRPLCHAPAERFPALTEAERRASERAAELAWEEFDKLLPDLARRRAARRAGQDPNQVSRPDKAAQESADKQVSPPRPEVDEAYLAIENELDDKAAKRKQANPDTLSRLQAALGKTHPARATGNDKSESDPEQAAPADAGPPDEPDGGGEQLDLFG